MLARPCKASVSRPRSKRSGQSTEAVDNSVGKKVKTQPTPDEMGLPLKLATF